MRGITTDELDMQLLHVVQIAPRISWSQAGAVLGLSAGAVAARWIRMLRAGVAWTAVEPNPVADGVLSAMVDIWCGPARRSEVIARLCADRRVVSLEECSSQGRDLLATVIVRGREGLGEFLLDDLRTMAGVTGSTCRVITSLHSSGSRWRVGALDARQQRAVLQGMPPRSRGGSGSLSAQDEALVAALCVDPRAAVAQLARATTLTPATARRHLQRVVSSGRLRFRCDLAPQFAGWPLTLYLLLRVPPADLPRSITALTDIPQVRMCMTVTGDANLMVSVHARTVAGLTDLDRAIGAVAPTLQQVESILELRSHKQMGWLLHPDGRSTGTVVVPAVFAPG